MREIQINIDPDSGETKLQQVLNELMRIITTSLKEGDLLPSVNHLSKTLGISRDTVFKAYSELKRRGVVDSKPMKGYFVCSNQQKVLMLLDYYSPFKDLVYREVEHLKHEGIGVDLVFHHYNQEVFDSLILESIGRYNYYIVMNVDTQRFSCSEVLKKISPGSLLFLDIPIEEWGVFDKEKHNYVFQDFTKSVLSSLEQISEEIKKYQQFNLVYHDNLQHPAITLKVFNQFCQEQEVRGHVIEKEKQLVVEKGHAYFTVLQQDIYTILNQCREKGFQVGTDVGILAYNDIPLYEFVADGISVISTDFKEMGRLAAAFISNRKEIKKIIPTKVILRNSL